MINKVLFVDDEPSVLEGYKRMLHREFQVDTAVGGLQGLALIRDDGPYSVVISDMRMPGMNGAQFLSQVRQAAPDTVRMLLTGYTDIDAAMEAVNQGNIFRFLAKPCEKEALIEAINAGVYQYRLVMVEKELLEDTLMGSIKVMTDVLSAASPEAFGRSMRITRYVRHMIAKFNLSSPWRFETAAMLSQLGCVTLDSEVMQAAFVGELDGIGGPVQLANAFSAYTDNVGDPEMRAAFATELAAMERHIGELLAEAVACGELDRPVTPRLVATVLAAVQGTMLIWAIAPRGDIKERIHEALEMALGRAG